MKGEVVVQLEAQRLSNQTRADCMCLTVLKEEHAVARPDGEVCPKRELQRMGHLRCIVRQYA